MEVQFTSLSLKNNSLHIQVAQQLAERILKGELSTTSVLPNELVLCEQFNVSRTALREAIKLLTSKGLLTSKPKIGTKVQPKEHWNFLDPQLLEWLSHVSSRNDIYYHFLFLRKAIEPEACALAAEHATEAQRKELTEIFEEMKQIAKAFDHDQWTIYDLRFHQLIFQATHNDFFLPLGNVLSSMMRNFLYFSSEMKEVCYNEHLAIYEAIIERDPERARVAAVDLLKEEKHRFLLRLA